MYRWVRPLLFRMDPERAHHLTLSMLSAVPIAARFVSPPFNFHPSLQQRLWNLTFPHPVGLAAGLDKDGVALHGLAYCGFSYIEAGTVTPRPQPGNPSPRLFRLVPDEAIINRMGFNNAGSSALRRRLEARPRPCIVGANLGKNKSTPNEDALADYLRGLEDLYGVADYFVINVSSPNTPGLRDLQAAEQLTPLIQAVLARRDSLHAAHANGQRPPVLVKLAPDLADENLQELAAGLCTVGVDGFIATNTTIARPYLVDQHRLESGGLSGRPLRERATKVIRLLRQVTGGRVPIIGCGGVFTAADAYEKIKAGADLIQIYTGFIYRGPGIVGEIVNGLAALLTKDGFQSVRDAVGTEANASTLR
ncbi:MAG: quinone-dependent dihydroorotate dehydrogenase [Alicyclobacillus sp.]|nr:quinone-dependent dihydroorotate dehydrogenase [Alicyclobacillus sp.]